MRLINIMRQDLPELQARLKTFHKNVSDGQYGIAGEAAELVLKFLLGCPLASETKICGDGTPGGER